MELPTTIPKKNSVSQLSKKKPLRPIYLKFIYAEVQQCVGLCIIQEGGGGGVCVSE